MHFTALPTAGVIGFDKNDTLKIGSSTAWVTDTPGPLLDSSNTPGRAYRPSSAMDRDERLMAVLGARLLESQKKVGETAQAIELSHGDEILPDVRTNEEEARLVGAEKPPPLQTPAFSPSATKIYLMWVNLRLATGLPRFIMPHHEP